MIARALSRPATPLLAGYPALVVTGPRQSGKTTFAKSTFPEHPYVNLESPLEQARFREDPVGFLDRFPDGAILDEAQHIENLLSFLQVRIDEKPRMGRWILTGSTQVGLTRGVAQSLAGRVAHLELLPFSYSEVRSTEKEPLSLASAVLRGGYPPLYDRARTLEPARWLEDYLATFVRRDVRDILDVRNREAFDRFLRHCANRTGQILDLTQLGRDCAVDAKTIRSWLSVLEACYVVHLLRPHSRNFGKRLMKRPKIYFVDSGLACRLLHISDVNQAVFHPLWGALVETWCVSEILKTRVHAARPRNLWYWRSSDRIEIDVIIETDGGALLPIEIKATSAASSQDATGIVKLRKLSCRDPSASVLPGMILYNGDEGRLAGEDRFVPWNAIGPALEDVS